MKNIFLIFSLVLFFGFVIVIYKKNKNTRYPTVDICIPCIPRDVPKLPRLFNSIQHQTLYPNTIHIGLSETSDKQGKQLQHKLQSIVPSIPVYIHTTPQKGNASENRNHASSFSQAKYVSFMDADDMMCPHRMEIIMRVFQGHPSLKCVVHGYTSQSSSCQPPFWSGTHRLGTHLYQDMKDRPKVFHVNEKVHHGHPTVRRDVLKSIQYNKEMERAQDSVFIRDILHKYGPNNDTILFIETPLTQYKPASQQL